MNADFCNIPPAAVDAAMKAAPDQHISLGHWEPAISRSDMRRGLEAAPPPILREARRKLPDETADEVTAITEATVLEAGAPPTGHCGGRHCTPRGADHVATTSRCTN